jgi:hypothetical protein
MTPAAGNQGRERSQTAAEARAEFEQRRAVDRERREAEMRRRYEGGIPGRWILASSWAATLLFAVVTVPAVLDPEQFVAVFFVVSVGLFLVGCVLFAVDLVLAAARSRDDVMGIGGLFFLAGSAPRRVQLHLLGSLAVQVVVAFAAAASNPFTPLAFGTLVPTAGLSLAGLWSVRHGMFPGAGRRADSPTGEPGPVAP